MPTDRFGDIGDFYYQSIVDSIDSESTDDFVNKLEDARINSTSLIMDFDCSDKDGLYEDKLYAVWERIDVEQLIERLEKALKDGYDMKWINVNHVVLPQLYGDYLFQIEVYYYEVMSLWDDEEFNNLKIINKEVPDYYEAWIKIEPMLED